MQRFLNLYEIGKRRRNIFPKHHTLPSLAANGAAVAATAQLLRSHHHTRAVERGSSTSKDDSSMRTFSEAQFVCLLSTVVFFSLRFVLSCTGVCVLVCVFSFFLSFISSLKISSAHSHTIHPIQQRPYYHPLHRLGVCESAHRTLSIWR